MVQIPAFCLDCGQPFPTGLEVSNPMPGATLGFSGSRASPCPACGGTGEIPDGIFTVLNDALTLISGPQISRERLWLLREVIERARTERLAPHQVEAVAVAAIPEAAGLFAEFKSYKPLTKLLAVMTIVSFYLDYGPTPREFLKALDAIMDLLNSASW